MNPLRYIKKLSNRMGWDIKKFPDRDTRRRMLLLKTHNINNIIDVGANDGQYGRLLRKLGYQGKIVSFEPLPDVFRILEKTALNDSNWEVYNFAIGNQNNIQLMNVSKNSVSSSLLDILPEHLESAPSSGYVDKIEIQTKTLNSLDNTLTKDGDKTFLKLDVQGYEMNVLNGADKFLNKVYGLQLEMSLGKLYKDEPNYLEVMSYLTNLGFKLYSIENGFFNPVTGKLLQIDGIFFKE